MACAQVKNRSSQQFHIACVYNPYGNTVNDFVNNVFPPSMNGRPGNPYPQPGSWNGGHPHPGTRPIYPQPGQPGTWNDNRPVDPSYPQPTRPGYNTRPGYDNVGPYSPALSGRSESASASVAPIAPVISAAPVEVSNVQPVEETESAAVPVSSVAAPTDSVPSAESTAADESVVAIVPDVSSDGSYAVPPARIN